ncbi:hypothetical protein FACS1894122_10770 [Alphaproteobacteria bacterium]|nr:hypothetical protein FACS1894122_10770 [Alphaproteobacteria bacterium]
MDKRKLFILCCVMLVVVLLMEPAFCGITDGQIKAASKSFTGAMHDWTPAVIGGGLLVSGMLIFANNYKAGLSGIAATAFIYAAKAFTGTGEACLILAAPIVVAQPTQMASASSEMYADCVCDVEAKSAKVNGSNVMVVVGGSDGSN